MRSQTARRMRSPSPRSRPRTSRARRAAWPTASASGTFPGRTRPAAAARAAVLRNGSVGMRSSETETTRTPGRSTRAARTVSPRAVKATPRQSKPGPRLDVVPGAKTARLAKLFFFLAQLGQHRVVLERRRVPHRLLPRRDVAQQTAHDLPAARLGQGLGEADVVGPGQGAELLPDVALQLGAQRLVGRAARARGDEADERAAPQLVRTAHDRGLRDLRVRDERALDLHRAEAVAGDVDDVVHAAHDPAVAVLVAPRAVAGEVDSREALPVLLDVTLGVLVDRAQHGRPGLLG